MITLVQGSTITLLNCWDNIVEAEGGLADINIDKHVRSFSGDVISRACFGSNYFKGEEIFLRLRALQEAASKRLLATGIPGMRYIRALNHQVDHNSNEFRHVWYTRLNNCHIESYLAKNIKISCVNKFWCIFQYIYGLFLCQIFEPLISTVRNTIPNQLDQWLIFYFQTFKQKI